jgi:hypothetical protein
MARVPLGLALPVLLCALAAAQGDLKSRLLPVTSPPRHAGIYHVDTGTWTRGARTANSTGPVTIYDNSCAVVYFTGMHSSERFQHRSRLPSPTGPTTNSIFYGTSDTSHRYDERPGCSDAYTIVGFEVAYCSSHVGPVDWQYQFASSFTACGSSDMVPQHTIDVTGLPGGASNGDQACWIVEVDVGGLPGEGFALNADGDGTYDGPSTLDQFGRSFGPASPTVLADFTGPILAGDYTLWPLPQPPVPCTGTDGTIWDSPALPGSGPQPIGEILGTGMSSNDFFRDAGGPVSAPSGPGCYAFGTLHSDFYLKLFSINPCGPEVSFVKYCAGGVGGIVTCPCGNPQVPANSMKGCNNFVAGGTGGAVLDETDSASLSADSLVMTSTAEAPAVTISVLFQGTSNAANLRTGAGVRCVGGTLKRLYKGDSVGGSIQFPNTAVSIHDQSAAKGFPIVPPMTLYYYCTYQNAAANGQPGCPGFSFGFNATNAGAVSWLP